MHWLDKVHEWRIGDLVAVSEYHSTYAPSAFAPPEYHDPMRDRHGQFEGHVGKIWQIDWLPQRMSADYESISSNAVVCHVTLIFADDSHHTFLAEQLVRLENL